MNEAFVMKFIQAKRLEKEAFKELLPDEVTKHTEVIEQELKEMVKELLGEGLKNGFDIYMKAKASAAYESENTSEPTQEESNTSDHVNNKTTMRNSTSKDSKINRKSSHVRAITID